MDATLKKFIAGVRKEHDDDVVDRAVYATSVYILGFFAVLIMAKQYVGDPLQCWLPAEYTGAWERYIENYCFVENTYYVAQNQSSKMLVFIDRESSSVHSPDTVAHTYGYRLSISPHGVITNYAITNGFLTSSVSKH